MVYVELSERALHFVDIVKLISSIIEIWRETFAASSSGSFDRTSPQSIVGFLARRIESPWRRRAIGGEFRFGFGVQRLIDASLHHWNIKSNPERTPDVFVGRTEVEPDGTRLDTVLNIQRRLRRAVVRVGVGWVIGTVGRLLDADAVDDGADDRDADRC